MFTEPSNLGFILLIASKIRCNAMVPQTDDKLVPVEHLGVECASKTLGLITAPSGSPIAALSRISEKVQMWINRAKNAKLSWRNVWFLVNRQFWPKVGFGISTVSASFDDSTKCLHRQYYQLLPLGGICRSVPMQVQYLGTGFYGSGCPCYRSCANG